MEKIKEIEQICAPIVEYLEKNYNPHNTIIIKSDSIKLVSDEISIPVSKQND